RCPCSSQGPRRRPFTFKKSHGCKKHCPRSQGNLTLDNFQFKVPPRPLLSETNSIDRTPSKEPAITLWLPLWGQDNVRICTDGKRLGWHLPGKGILRHIVAWEIECPR